MDQRPADTSSKNEDGKQTQASVSSPVSAASVNSPVAPRSSQSLLPSSSSSSSLPPIIQTVATKQKTLSVPLPASPQLSIARLSTNSSATSSPAAASSAATSPAGVNLKDRPSPVDSRKSSNYLSKKAALALRATLRQTLVQAISRNEEQAPEVERNCDAMTEAFASKKEREKKEKETREKLSRSRTNTSADLREIAAALKTGASDQSVAGSSPGTESSLPTPLASDMAPVPLSRTSTLNVITARSRAPTIGSPAAKSGSRKFSYATLATPLTQQQLDPKNIAGAGHLRAASLDTRSASTTPLPSPLPTTGSTTTPRTLGRPLSARSSATATAAVLPKSDSIASPASIPPPGVSSSVPQSPVVIHTPRTGSLLDGSTTIPIVTPPAPAEAGVVTSPAAASAISINAAAGAKDAETLHVNFINSTPSVSRIDVGTSVSPPVVISPPAPSVTSLSSLPLGASPRDLLSPSSSASEEPSPLHIHGEIITATVSPSAPSGALSSNTKDEGVGADQDDVDDAADAEEEAEEESSSSSSDDEEKKTTTDANGKATEKDKRQQAKKKNKKKDRSKSSSSRSASDSDDPTSSYYVSHRVFEEAEEKAEKDAADAEAAAEATENLNEHKEADSKKADHSTGGTDEEKDTVTATPRKMRPVPILKKRTASFSTLYHELQMQSADEDRMKQELLEHQQQQNGGAVVVATADEPTGSLKNKKKKQQKQQRRFPKECMSTRILFWNERHRCSNPFCLGPRPRLKEAHGRFQLWSSGILYFLAIVLQLCSLWSDDWLENTATNLQFLGKDLIQWILIGIASFCGIIGYTMLLMRFHGLDLATNAYKVWSILLLIAQAVLAFVATALYDRDHQDIVDSSGGHVTWGSSHDFCALARSYSIVSLLLILWQEWAEFWSRTRAWRFDASLHKLREMRAAVREAQAYASSHPGESSSGGGSNNGGAGATDPESQMAGFNLHSQEVLNEVTRLGLSSEASARLLSGGLEALPTTESIQQVVETLYMDKDYLSRGQRRLVWASNICFSIIFGGGMFYSVLEGWNARSSIDFAVVTLGTIGYGNQAPKTDLGRLFLYLYFPFGFAVVGYTVNTWWKVVLFKLDHRVTYLSKWISKKVQERKEAVEAKRRAKMESEEARRKEMEEKVKISLQVEPEPVVLDVEALEHSVTEAENDHEVNMNPLMSPGGMHVDRSRSSRGQAHDSDAADEDEEEYYQDGESPNPATASPNKQQVESGDGTAAAANATQPTSSTTGEPTSSTPPSGVSQTDATKTEHAADGDGTNSNTTSANTDKPRAEEPSPKKSDEKPVGDGTTAATQTVAVIPPLVFPSTTTTDATATGSTALLVANGSQIVAQVPAAGVVSTSTASTPRVDEVTQVSPPPRNDRREALLSKEARKERARFIKLGCALAFAFAWMMFAGAVFANLEEWRYFDSVYFCFVTLTTVGYGDLFPSKSNSSAFFLWFIIFGLGSITYILTLLGEILTESAAKTREADIKRKAKIKARKAKLRAAEHAAAEARIRAKEQRYFARRRSVAETSAQRRRLNIDGTIDEGNEGYESVSTSSVAGIEDDQIQLQIDQQHDQQKKPKLLSGDAADKAGAGAADVEGEEQFDEQGTGSEAYTSETDAEGEDPDVRATLANGDENQLAKGAIKHRNGKNKAHHNKGRHKKQHQHRLAAHKASSAKVGGGFVNSGSEASEDECERVLQQCEDDLAAAAATEAEVAPECAAIPDAPPLTVGPNLSPQDIPLTLDQQKIVLAKSRAETMILAPPTIFLEFAEEFSQRTKDIIEKARKAVQHVQANANLFDENTLDQYHASYLSLLRAEEKRKKVFETQWMRNMIQASRLERDTEETRSRMLDQIKTFQFEQKRKRLQQAMAQSNQLLVGGNLRENVALKRGSNSLKNVNLNDLNKRRGSHSVHSTSQPLFKAQHQKALSHMHGGHPGSSGSNSNSNNSQVRSNSGNKTKDAKLPSDEAYLAEPFYSSSSSSSGEEDDMDWSRNGRSKRTELEKLIPIAPPLTKPNIPVAPAMKPATTQRTSVLSPQAQKRAAIAKYGTLAKACATVQPAPNTSAHDMAAAVARALNQAKKKLMFSNNKPANAADKNKDKDKNNKEKDSGAAALKEVAANLSHSNSDVAASFTRGASSSSVVSASSSTAASSSGRVTVTSLSSPRGARPTMPTPSVVEYLPPHVMNDSSTDEEELAAEEKDKVKNLATRSSIVEPPATPKATRTNILTETPPSATAPASGSTTSPAPTVAPASAPSSSIKVAAAAGGGSATKMPVSPGRPIVPANYKTLARRGPSSFHTPFTRRTEVESPPPTTVKFADDPKPSASKSSSSSSSNVLSVAPSSSSAIAKRRAKMKRQSWKSMDRFLDRNHEALQLPLMEDDANDTNDATDIPAELGADPPQPSESSS